MMMGGMTEPWEGKRLQARRKGIAPFIEVASGTLSHVRGHHANCQRPNCESSKRQWAWQGTEEDGDLNLDLDPHVRNALTRGSSSVRQIACEKSRRIVRLQDELCERTENRCQKNEKWMPHGR